MRGRNGPSPPRQRPTLDLPGLFIGVVVSILLLVYRSSRPGDVGRHPEDEPAPGIAVLRVESALFFANADVIRNEIRRYAAQGARAIVLDAASVPAIDVTAVTMLVELAEDLLRDGIELVLARDIAAVRDLVRLHEAGTGLRSFPTVQAAVDELAPPGQR